jgi:DNA-binding transcriptional regulator WhiA
MKDNTMDNQQRKVLDKIIKQTAYSIGAFMGDGYSQFYVDKRGYSCWYTELSCMDIEIVNRFAMEINSTFGTKYKIMNRILNSSTVLYTIRASRKTIFDFFNSITGNKHSLPIEIIRGELQTKLDFLAGIFDTDGTVKVTESWNGNKTAKNPRWQIGFSSNIPELVEDIAALLNSIGVSVGRISSYKKASYKTMYSIHPNIRSFIEAGCYFEASRKQNRLRDYLSHVLSSETMYTASVTTEDDIVRA